MAEKNVAWAAQEKCSAPLSKNCCQDSTRTQQQLQMLALEPLQSEHHRLDDGAAPGRRRLGKQDQRCRERDRVEQERRRKPSQAA